MLAVDDREIEAEFLRQFVLPLQQHRCRCGDHDGVDPAAQQELAHNQAGLDRLAEADIVADQEIHTRQLQSLGERQQLIGFEPDAGAERRLEQLAVGGGRGAPFGRAQIGAQALRALEGAREQRRPVVGIEDLRLQLGEIGQLDRLALRIVLARDERDDIDQPPPLGAFDNPALAANFEETADLRHGRFQGSDHAVVHCCPLQSNVRAATDHAPGRRDTIHG
ncbi:MULTISPECIES: hypothetical protein [unclassified Bradyrhizobium]|uniref:hypothetical protein n=1 Tax=unclassified Bradyrhizobium TaxID=2631580 RepID=UPI0029161367|nr:MULTISPECIES: hypothetical protein [unclassified Bradyrhizobium]